MYLESVAPSLGWLAGALKSVVDIRSIYIFVLRAARASAFEFVLVPRNERNATNERTNQEGEFSPLGRVERTREQKSIPRSPFYDGNSHVWPLWLHLSVVGSVFLSLLLSPRSVLLLLLALLAPTRLSKAR